MGAYAACLDEGSAKSGPACRFDRNRLTNYTAGDTRDFADAFHASLD
jgi:hypothetical protein